MQSPSALIKFSNLGSIDDTKILILGIDNSCNTDFYVKEWLPLKSVTSEFLFLILNISIIIVIFIFSYEIIAIFHQLNTPN